MTRETGVKTPSEAMDIINNIIDRGNDVKIKRRDTHLVILEEKAKIIKEIQVERNPNK
ncbi:hypothetical protein LQZ18_18280 [Lachnospiraceae bacterium ZAX-1]